MADTKPARVLFFRPTCVDPKQSFAAHLKTLAAKKKPVVFEGEGFESFTLSLVKDTDGLWTGEFVRKRLKDLPSKITADNMSTELELKDDEGLGESTAFAYCEKKGVLTFMRNSHVGTEKSLARYVAHAAGTPEFDMNACLSDSDPFDRLADMVEIKKIEVSMESSPQQAKTSTPDRSLEILENAVSRFGGTTLQLVIGSHRGKADLNPKETKEFLKGLAKRNQVSRVSKLKVAGASKDDDRFELLDLLKNLIEEEVELPASGKTIPYESKRKGVVRAFGLRRDAFKDTSHS